MGKKKILLCVEGEKTEEKLLQYLFEIYGLDLDFTIVPYRTNIHQLYRQMFEDPDPASLDLLQVLKERERDPEKRALLSERYTDIFLVFDFEPQDTSYSSDHLAQMLEFFCESTDAGKLYLNYPMVEAFYHLSKIPDPAFSDRCVPLSLLHTKGEYKKLVNAECVTPKFSRFAKTKAECDTVLRSHRNKAWKLTGAAPSSRQFPPQSDILRAEAALLDEMQLISILSTVGSFILEYDESLVEEA